MNRTLSLVRKICQVLSYFALLALASATLISCAGNPAKIDAAETAQQQSEQAAADEEALEQQNLPKVDLSADLMYKLMLSDLARQQNNNELALAALVDVAIETRDPRLAAQATRQAVISNQYTIAIQMALLWKELTPDNVDVHQTLGNLLVVEQRLGEATAHYSKALALTDENNRSELLKQISATLIRYGNQKQALQLIEQLSQEYPASADVALAHASIAAAVKEYGVANTEINRTLALDPDDDNAAVFKFSLLLLQKKDQEATDFAVLFLKKHPKSIVLRTTLARHYLESDQLKAAEKQYLVIHRQDDTSLIAPMALALIRMDSKDYDAASVYLEKVLALQADNDLARVYLGDIASQQERLDEAVQWYRSVTDKEQFFNARLRLVDVIMKRDGFDAALVETEALHPETDSQQSDLILLKNELLTRSGRSAEALELINNALDDNPDDIDLLYARGMIAASNNDVAGLEKDMLRVLEIKPGHVQALNAYGFTLADLTSRYEEAYSLISAALKQKPGDPYILDSMGWVEFRLGNYAEAESFLRKALEKRNDAEIASHLAEVLFAAGNIREAKKVWAKANRDFPENDKLMAVGEKLHN